MDEVFVVAFQGDVDCGGRCEFACVCLYNGIEGAYSTQGAAKRAATTILPHGDDATQWHRENWDYGDRIVYALTPEDHERSALLVLRTEIEGET